MSSCSVYRNSAIAKALAGRGHNVTMISLDKDKIQTKNLHHIYIEGLYNEFYYETVKGFYTYKQTLNPLLEPQAFNEYWFDICKSNVPI